MSEKCNFNFKWYFLIYKINIHKKNIQIWTTMFKNLQIFVDNRSNILNF